MDNRILQLRDMAEKELKGNILPFWSTVAVDNENGGFYGAIDDDNNVVKDASKCLILGARLLWTFSSITRLTGDATARAMADRAYDYFINKFYDQRTGGAHYMLTAQGQPEDEKKHIYGQSFSIYSLSEYYRATGCETAYNAAYTIFSNLNKHAWDPVNKGYCEALNYDWSRNPDFGRTNINPIEGCTKTMNTHLHLIESFTALHLAKENPTVRNKLREMLYIFLNRIINPTIHHQFMFFNDQYESLNAWISYGHDIECSWLLMEAAEALGEREAIEAAHPLCANMARACLEESMGEDGAMCNEFDPVKGHWDMRRVWWVQAETVVGYLNAYQLTGEEKFLDASLKCMQYIDKYLVDHEHGEWFAGRAPDGTRKPGLKVQGWKTPYHNGRMCLEVMERAKKFDKR